MTTGLRLGFSLAGLFPTTSTIVRHSLAAGGTRSPTSPRLPASHPRTLILTQPFSTPLSGKPWFDLTIESTSTDCFAVAIGLEVSGLHLVYQDRIRAVRRVQVSQPAKTMSVVMVLLSVKPVSSSQRTSHGVFLLMCGHRLGSEVREDLPDELITTFYTTAYLSNIQRHHCVHK